MNWYFQMYSARNTALQESLEIISNAGYHGIEIYGDNLEDVGALQLGLKKHGLVVPSMHINLPRLLESREDCVKQAHELSCNHIVCPYLEENQRPSDAKQWQALAHDLQQIAKHLEAAGFTFAWHNHDFEFIALDDGSYPIEHLLDTADNVSWEIDVAWIAKAQQDPTPWIARYKTRITAVHLKDIAPDGDCTDEDGWADLGEGVVPWGRLMQQLSHSPAALYITEHDNPSDLQRFANRSIKAATRLHSIGIDK